MNPRDHDPREYEPGEPACGPGCAIAPCPRCFDAIERGAATEHNAPEHFNWCDCVVDLGKPCDRCNDEAFARYEDQAGDHEGSE